MQTEINPKSLIDDGSFVPHWENDVTEEEYHADKRFVGSSSLKKILIWSPKTFHSDFILGRGKLPTPAMRMGKLVHMAILEGDKFEERYVIMPVFEGYTKDGKKTTNANAADVREKKANWLAELQMTKPDAVIVSAEEREDIIGMVKAIKENETASKFFAEGLPEVSGYYVDPETKLKLKFRPDFLSLDRKVMVDLKKSINCKWESFQYDIWSDGTIFDPKWYDFQMAMYCEGFAAITGERLKLASWIAVQENHPYENATHPLTGATQALGLVKYRRALRLLRDCIDSNRWPGIQEAGEPSFIVPPEHILNKYEVNFDGELI